MPRIRKCNQEGVNLIMNFESCHLRAYKCPAGIWTIGWGHTGEDVRPGLEISQVVADQWLLLDIEDACEIVQNAVKVPLTDNQFSALVSFVYNVGAGRTRGKSGFVRLKDGQPSTMLRKLNVKDYEGAAQEFLKWTRAGGVELRGLRRRREAEKALFEK